MKVRLTRDQPITLYKDGEYEARKLDHGGYELTIRETLTVSSSDVEEVTYELGGVKLIVGDFYDVTTRKGRLYRGRRFVGKSWNTFAFESDRHARTNVWANEGATITRSDLNDEPEPAL